MCVRLIYSGSMPVSEQKFKMDTNCVAQQIIIASSNCSFSRSQSSDLVKLPQTISAYYNIGLINKEENTSSNKYL